jgi:hypothetical protein
MALLDHQTDYLYNDDYRAYLIKQNEPPIVHESEGRHLKRLAARGRVVIATVTGWGKALYVAIRNAKYRRLQRELMWHGIPYSYLLENDEETKPSDATNDRPGKLP